MHVFLIAAISADGFLGQDETHNSMEWTSEEDSQWFWQRTEQAGAIVMGRKTFGATRRPYTPLPKRKNYVLTSDPVPWQVKSEYPLSRLEYTNLSPKELVKFAEKESTELGFSELAVCGGSSVYSQFLLADLLDTLYLTRENNVKLGEGIPLFAAISLAEALKKYQLIQETALNDHGTVMQEWGRKK
ncbi:MAG: hypothetical protein AUK08_02060 [Candidatus Pacebacteria bacterium CG2_30_36_39]|nr:dihydrofolate reductase [Candidatus Pacearchaeota archaeon]OIP74019.1 MAG: hypothetical protein AUK08_02060 [Candidatus Pacebacteria bacterium CG2_30_36_39]